MNPFRHSPADRSGVAALEFSLLAPVLLLLMLVGYDATLWVRVAFRLDETAANMGEVISQCSTINDPADISRFETNAQAIAGTTDISSHTGGAFIISAIGYDANMHLSVLWQRQSGNPIYGSRIGAPGSAPALGAYVLPQGELAIATEVFSGVQPWVLSRAFMPKAAFPSLYTSALLVARAANPGGIATLTPSNTGALACAS